MLKDKIEINDVFNPVSPSSTYVIYDQFHWKNNSHFEEKVKGWEAALSRYNFHKILNPQCTLGLCTLEYYNYLKVKLK